MTTKSTETAIYVSPGVKAGGDGFIIVNEKIIRVHPRGPEFNQLEAGVNLVLRSGDIISKELQKKVLEYGKELIGESMEKLTG